MSAELMTSKFVPSSVRPSVLHISEPNAWISFKYWLLFPLSHTFSRFFFFFWFFFLNFWEFFFYEYVSFWLTWDPMEAKIAKRYSYKSQPKVFKLFFNFLLFPILQIARISEAAASRGKQAQFWPPGVEIEYMCNFRNLANGQVSCPNLAILKIGPYLGNHCPLRENKLNFDPLGYTSWGRKRIYVQLLELWPMTKLHAQVFWKWPNISETAVRWAKIRAISPPPPGVDRPCVTSDLANCQVSWPNMAILKIGQ